MSARETNGGDTPGCNREGVTYSATEIEREPIDSISPCAIDIPFHRLHSSSSTSTLRSPTSSSSSSSTTTTTATTTSSTPAPLLRLEDLSSDHPTIYEQIMEIYHEKFYAFLYTYAMILVLSTCCLVQYIRDKDALILQSDVNISLSSIFAIMLTFMTLAYTWTTDQFNELISRRIFIISHHIDTEKLMMSSNRWMNMSAANIHTHHQHSNIDLHNMSASESASASASASPSPHLASPASSFTTTLSPATADAALSPGHNSSTSLSLSHAQHTKPSSPLNSQPHLSDQHSGRKRHRNLLLDVNGPWSLLRSSRFYHHKPYCDVNRFFIISLILMFAILVPIQLLGIFAINMDKVYMTRQIRIMSVNATFPAVMNNSPYYRAPQYKHHSDPSDVLLGAYARYIQNSSIPLGVVYSPAASSSDSGSDDNNLRNTQPLSLLASNLDENDFSHVRGQAVFHNISTLRVETYCNASSDIFTFSLTLPTSNITSYNSVSGNAAINHTAQSVVNVQAHAYLNNRTYNLSYQFVAATNKNGVVIVGDPSDGIVGVFLQSATNPFNDTNASNVTQIYGDMGSTVNDENINKSLLSPWQYQSIYRSSYEGILTDPTVYMYGTLCNIRMYTSTGTASANSTDNVVSIDYDIQTESVPPYSRDMTDGAGRIWSTVRNIIPTMFASLQRVVNADDWLLQADTSRFFHLLTGTPIAPEISADTTSPSFIDASSNDRDKIYVSNKTISDQLTILTYHAARQSIEGNYYNGMIENNGTSTRTVHAIVVDYQALGFIIGSLVLMLIFTIAYTVYLQNKYKLFHVDI